MAIIGENENNDTQMKRYEDAFEKYLGMPVKDAQKSVPSRPKVSWEDIWAHVVGIEGGYGNNPLDRGGPTKYGISSRSYPHLDIKNLTIDQAKSIFKNDYYDKVQGDTLLKLNPGIAAHVADMAFNGGQETAIHLLYDAVGLPRRNTITPELLARIGPDEKIVEAYSKARLLHYAGLRDAPIHIRDWTSRINKINNALGLRSGLGGYYGAARTLDTEYMVKNQYGSMYPVRQRFPELTDEEKEYLLDRERRRLPGYQAAMSAMPAKLDDTVPSSVADIFMATQLKGSSVDSRVGLDNLIAEEAREAYRLNMEAAGKKGKNAIFPSQAEFGMYGSSYSKHIFDQIDRLKRDFPEVDFPIKSMDQVYARALDKARTIENRYENLKNYKIDSISGVAGRLGQVLFGYLPGQIVGMAQDPYELALMVATGGEVKGLSSLGKMVVGTFLGEGAIQTGVQSKRKELGLEGGFVEGLSNAAGAAAGVAALGGISLGLQKIWKRGGGDVAKIAEDIANKSDDFLSKERPTIDTLYAKQEINDLREFANVYRANPYGNSYEAKVQFDTRMTQAASDLANGKPIRIINDDIKKFVGNDKRFVKDMTTALKESGPDGEILAKKFKEQAINWDKFKKSQITRTIFSDINDVDYSMVPVLKSGSNDIYTFPTLDEARKFLKSKDAEDLISEYGIDIVQNPNGKGYFLGRSADLEPSNAISGRMVGEDVVEDTVNGVKVRGFKDSEDLNIAKSYPEYTRVREFVEKKLEDEQVLYPKDSFVQDAKDYQKQIREALDTSKANFKPGSTEERLIRRLEQMEQEHMKAFNKPAMLDIGDTVGVEERVLVRDFINEMKEERAGLAGMMDCMVN